LATNQNCKPINSSRFVLRFYGCFTAIGYLSHMIRKLKAFLKDESGATAIEYGLIATGIAVAIIPVITGLGSKLKTTFTSISSALR
jgi:pilus assembly protein Flp/PilA